MCCEFNVLVFFCGGSNCDIVSECCGSIGKFAGLLCQPFKGTSLGKCMSCSGNVLADLQALIVLGFWLGACWLVLFFVALGTMSGEINDEFAKIYNAETTTIAGTVVPSYTTTTAPLLPEISPVQLIIPMLVCCCELFFGSMLSWFGMIKRRGCVWLPTWPLPIICIESDAVLYLIGFQAAVASVFCFLAFLRFLFDGWWQVALYFLFPMLIQCYFAYFVCKIAGMDEEERLHDLEMGSDDEYGVKYEEGSEGDYPMDSEYAVQGVMADPNTRYSS